MYIHRKPSTVMKVINSIYQPIAQKFGVSLLLRNEINTEIEFPPRFFINLIQITGNLVANAIKFTSPNGLVDVVFNMEANADCSTIKMKVTDTGNIISPELVSALNQNRKVAELMGTEVEDNFGTRLAYVIQLVTEEEGHFFVKSEETSGTTFYLSLPLQGNYVNNRNGYQSIIENIDVLLNGSLN